MVAELRIGYGWLRRSGLRFHIRQEAVQLTSSRFDDSFSELQISRLECYAGVQRPGCVDCSGQWGQAVRPKHDEGNAPRHSPVNSASR